MPQMWYTKKFFSLLSILAKSITVISISYMYTGWLLVYYRLAAPRRFTLLSPDPLEITV